MYAFMNDKTVMVTSNIEGGKGQPDISIEFRSQETWIIFEFKRAQSPSDNLNVLALKAKEQIIANRYYMRNVGTSYLVGIAFYGKDMSSLAVGKHVEPLLPRVAGESSEPESGVAPAAENQLETKRDRIKSSVAAGSVEDEDSASTSFVKKRPRRK